MSDEPKKGEAPEASEIAARRLSPEARRALAEAEERRRMAGTPSGQAGEVGGRKGPEPIRYGDWEKNGIISDF